MTFIKSSDVSLCSGLNCIKIGIRHFPKGIFPRDNFTSSNLNMYSYPCSNFPKDRLGSLKRCRLQQGPSAVARMGQVAERRGYNMPGEGGKHCFQDRLGKLPLGLLHIWEVATWEDTLGKLPFGKNPLGKWSFQYNPFKHYFQWSFSYNPFRHCYQRSFSYNPFKHYFQWSFSYNPFKHYFQWSF